MYIDVNRFWCSNRLYVIDIWDFELLILWELRWIGFDRSVEIFSGYDATEEDEEILGGQKKDIANWKLWLAVHILFD